MRILWQFQLRWMGYASGQYGVTEAGCTHSYGQRVGNNVLSEVCHQPKRTVVPRRQKMSHESPAIPQCASYGGRFPRPRRREGRTGEIWWPPRFGERTGLGD